MKLTYIETPEMKIESERPAIVILNDIKIEGTLASCLMDDVYDDNIPTTGYTVAIDANGSVEQVWRGEGIPEQFKSSWENAYPGISEKLTPNADGEINEVEVGNIVEFNRERFMKNPPPAGQDYCDRHRIGKVTAVIDEHVNV